MKLKILPKKKAAKHAAASVLWFVIGFVLAGSILASMVLFYFQYTYHDRVIPGVFVNDVYVGGKTKEQIARIFDDKNKKIGKNIFLLKTGDQTATISASALNAGYDENLIADQAINLGKTNNLPSDIYIVLSSYINGSYLNTPYTFDSMSLRSALSAVQKNVHKDAVDAQFTVQNNKVVAFRQSQNGQDVDFDKLSQKINDTVPSLTSSNKPKTIQIQIPIKVTEPNLTTSEANKFGIVEEIGEGHSTFYHSIPERVHNVALAASRINGALIAPGEEFSFDKTLGDVSAYTGYQQAYVISNGKTVLGDGGGVCQVSTTLFRAVLNAGLPITERYAHAYRVGYYEQDQPPGLDATTYVPTVDFRFKNDTGHYILIVEQTDTTNLTISFILYGKSDGRVSQVSTPVLSDVSPAPPDLYQDDPTLPAGTVKQVDFAAPGGKSIFTRTVTRDGKAIINDTFVSVYKPWQAVFLRGTKT